MSTATRRDMPWAPAATAARLEPMTVQRLDAVMQIEQAAYAVPWTRGNFIDSLAAGYIAHCLVDVASRVLAYSVAMTGADEIHLLNLTVAPSAQGRGHARRLLAVLRDDARQRCITQLWLEVRLSNERAQRLYRRDGWHEAGRRKGYYPNPPGAAGSEREDALLMRCTVDGADA